MNDEPKAMLLQTKTSYKVTSYMDTDHSRSVIMHYDDWRKIPKLSAALEAEKIDLDNFVGRLFVQFNRDGSINIIKEQNEPRI